MSTPSLSTPASATPTPTTPSLEIIVHIWAGQLPQYAHLAHYQLSSLFLYPPTAVRVTYTVCYSPDDPLTVELLHRFYWRASTSRSPSPSPPACRTTINLYAMPHDMLMRRAIGRNECARRSKADVVYFAGCDYAWGPGAIDAIAAASLANPDNLIYPRHVNISKTHALGDAAIAESTNRKCSFEQLAAVNEHDFTPTRVSRAIGCLQIVSGDVARARGYVPESPKWQRPADRWQRTFEDAIARNWFGVPSLAIEIPNIYRLRHSQQGRFVDENGCAVPSRKRAWKLRRAE